MKYDLLGLFKEAFNLEPEEEVHPISFLGTPIESQITFLEHYYHTFKDEGETFVNGEPYRERFNEFTLPASSIVSFSRKKIIATTHIPNSAGRVVKEIFGLEDYNISIKGFLIPDPFQKQGLKTVEQQESELLRWDNILEGVKVIGKPFTPKDINCLAIENIKISNLRGKPNIKPFEIQALGYDETMEFIEMSKQK